MPKELKTLKRLLYQTQ